MDTFSLVDEAIGFAAQAHDGHQRKVGAMPYIAHPVGVAMLLLRQGCDDTIIAAALLHDTVEDTAVTLDEIRARFGAAVADIVAGCTEGKGAWERRKQGMIDRLAGAPLAVKLVVAADKYHNLQHIERQLERKGTAVWRKFSRGAGQQAWYYRSVRDTVLANIAEPARYPIFDWFSQAVDRVFDGIPSRPPDD